MSKTLWSPRRLERLFAHYNSKYWRGRLPQYRIVTAKLDAMGAMGRCDWRKRLIEIDPDQHKTDRDMRGTLLHEMAHAATRTGHGLKFFAQMERLLRSGALAKIATGDAGHVKFYGQLVPQRFPLLRQRMKRLETRRARALDRFAAKHKIKTYYISDRDIVAEFKDYEAASRPWKTVLFWLGLEYG